MGRPKGSTKGLKTRVNLQLRWDVADDMNFIASHAGFDVGGRINYLSAFWDEFLSYPVRQLALYLRERDREKKDKPTLITLLASKAIRKRGLDIHKAQGKWLLRRYDNCVNSLCPSRKPPIRVNPPPRKPKLRIVK